MSNTNFFTNPTDHIDTLTVYIEFSCYSVSDSSFNISGDIMFKINRYEKSQYELSKFNNIWYLTLSIKNKYLFDVFTKPDIRFYLDMTSYIRIRQKEPPYITVTYTIYTIMKKEQNSLLIEMNPVRETLKYPLILNLKFDPNSNTEFILNVDPIQDQLKIGNQF